MPHTADLLRNGSPVFHRLADLDRRPFRRRKMRRARTRIANVIMRAWAVIDAIFASPGSPSLQSGKLINQSRIIKQINTPAI
jgi:hypothetical protein